MLTALFSGSRAEPAPMAISAALASDKTAPGCGAVHDLNGALAVLSSTSKAEPD